ncbi:hypothetical protein [Methylosoma difficile]
MALLLSKMRFTPLYEGCGGWVSENNLAFACVRNIFQTICFESKSRQRKSVAWSWPFATNTANTSGAIASLTVKRGRKKGRMFFTAVKSVGYFL